MTTSSVPAPVPFDWHCANVHGGIYYASLVRDGIRLHVIAETVQGPADPCFPASCYSPGEPVVKVTATALTGDPSRTTIADASASIHARLIRPAPSARSWRQGRAVSLGAQAIADCAADQVEDAIADARLRLADLVSYAATLGITATAAAQDGSR